jgi:hypothetical protein
LGLRSGEAREYPVPVFGASLIATVRPESPNAGRPLTAASGSLVAETESLVRAGLFWRNLRRRQGSEVAR